MQATTRPAARHPLAMLLALLLLLPAPVPAAVYDSINYQGYLTDAVGAPVDGTVDITFRLYTVASGGIAQWGETLTVQAEKGLFSVALGADTTNPLDATLFDTELWLGIEIAGDAAELAPRQLLTSAAFARRAFRADDAELLGGYGAADFAKTIDLADHAANASAHHNKTTRFSELTDQVADGQIPAAITRDAELAAHGANPAAHHPRYSNAEAVAAMGAKADVNPLHHDRYTDPEAVAALLAGDGAGSGLDADLLDGQHAAEIIAAASAEVRAAIGSVPFTINSPGSYYFTGDLAVGSASANGITVNADHVTIDLMGFSLVGPGSGTGAGIYLTGRSNVTIRNGTVRGFGGHGIVGGQSTEAANRVLDMRVLANGGHGVRLAGTDSLVLRCAVGDNGNYGISAGTAAHLVDNTAYNNQGAYGIAGGNAAILTGNASYNNSGIAIYGGFGAILTGNSAYANLGTGISAAAGATLAGNTASYNADWGIYGAGGNTIEDNTLYANNGSNTPGQGGLHVGSGSQVRGNTLGNNFQNNIYVYSSRNSIEENHVTNSPNGIYFFSPGNFYANNRASGNTVNYGNTAGNTDGGGNAAF